MAEYFSHDYDAREDEKIQNLIFKLGMEGYGIYWAVVEMLYKNAGVMQLECKRIAYALHTQENLVQSVVKDFELFDINDGTFKSQSVLKRLEMRAERSQKASDSAHSRWNANALHLQSIRNAIKGKEIKERKEIFIKQVNELSSPSNKDMIRNFIMYWTELTTNGEFMRFEIEKTWETKRRVQFWIQNSK